MKKILILFILTLGLASISHSLEWDEKDIIVGTDGTNSTYNQAEVTSTGELKVIGSTSTASLMEDSRYQGYTSTGTAGKVLTTGAISNTPTITTDYSFYVQGGDAQVIFSGKSGILYVYEGIPIDTILAIPLVSNTITLSSLTSGATFNYEVNGGN
jgi:hypothetical protein